MSILRSLAFIVIWVIAVSSTNGTARAESKLFDILEPRPGATLGMTSPATLAGVARVGRFLPSAYRWSLKDLQSGRLIQIPQAPGPGADGFSLSNRVVNVLPHRLVGVRPGAYELTLETLSASPQAQSPTVTTRTIAVNFAPEILTTTGLAPGRAVPGEDRMLLYGRALSGARVELTGPVLDADDPEVGGCADRQGGCPRTTLQGTTNETGTSLSFTIPRSTQPGLYRVAATRARLRSRSQWLRVDPPFVEPAPRSDRRGMARPLRSGQTVRERFAPRGATSGGLWDYELYYFVATAGGSIEVTLERVDKTKSWEHPDELDPEIYVVAPDGVVYGHLVGTDARPGIDLNAVIRKGLLPRTGLYFLVAGTTKGSGEYDLSFSLTSAPPGSEGDRALLVSNPLTMTNSQRAAQSIRVVLDPRGYPISGVALNFVPTDKTSVEEVEFTEGSAIRTTVDGFAPGTVRLLTPGMMGIASELYRCVPADPLLSANNDLPARQLEIPRFPLAGSAVAIIRDVDLIRGDMLLSRFEFTKISDR